ncbi:MAG TPA: nuclear transport factor 2 family protein [Candidatus Angelobacter sp.]|jgi:hypothetical protein|nr:nuclear transport factor 2 family protein [Candidatus Angelobacter sp.]
MRFLLTLMAFAMLAGCAGEPKHPTWNNATGAEQHERLMWQSVQSKDWTNVERRLSPTFTGVTPDGRMLDRVAWVQQWQNSQVREFSLGEVQVHPEGSDMKVTYIFHVQASGIGPVPPGGLRVVSIWQDIKGRWTLSATSITAIQSQ